jgi:lysozyme family protein
MAYISYDKYGPEYLNLWNTMHIIRDSAELQRLSDKIKQFKATYQAVEKDTGVPWQMIAVIHVREAGEQDIGRFKGVLHNGENIVGTGRRTRLVPAGRGPFGTWHDAAIDALRLQGFHTIKDWPIQRVLWALEPFNGYGYRNHGLRSPYLWASTNHQQPGKYVSDGVFDPAVVDRQIGCAALLKYLEFGKSSAIPAVITGTAAVVSAYFNTSDAYMIATAIGIGVAGYLIYKHFTRKTNEQPNRSVA